MSESPVSYEAGREILHGVDMKFPKGSFTAIVGESGCGKSTIASILMGRNKEYDGDVTVGKTQLSEINEASLMKNSLTFLIRVICSKALSGRIC